jgi:general secretion pathway protein A
MYEKFFGFTENPFKVTPDPRFLYLSPDHQEALASMIYGITERRGFISIIGEIGIGKTTLIHTLFKELGKEVKTAFIFNTNITFHDLLHNILIELELTPTSKNKSELLNQLNTFLIDKLSLDENVAVIIDEAQNLSSSVLEELRMLSNLETSREKLLQIVLVGQPELDTKLRSHELRQLKQRIGINCYLTPLTNEEQSKYITHRLSVAGCEDNHIFSQKALDLIVKNTRGIPRIINIICDNVLLTAYGKEQNKIDFPIVNEVIDDYLKTSYPQIIDKELANPVLKEKKIISTKLWATAVLFFFVLGILSIYGTLAYSNKFDSLEHFIDSLVSNLSIKKQIFLDSLNDYKQENDPTTMHEQTIQSLKSQNHDFMLMDAEQEIIDADESNTAKPSLIDQSSLPPIKYPTHVDSPTQFNITHYKTVFAKRGDMVSTFVFKEYGTINQTIFDIVKRSNPDIKDLDKIDIGTKIILPIIDFDSFILEIENNVFTIHIASFSSYKNAKEYLIKLKDSEHPLFLSPINIAGNDPWYRITIGYFSRRDKAIEIAKSMQSSLLALKQPAMFNKIFSR